MEFGWGTTPLKPWRAIAVLRKGDYPSSMPSLVPFTIETCPLETLKAPIAKYYQDRNIVVDSFWETHVRESVCYRIRHGEDEAGFFAIHKGTVLVLFHVFEAYRHRAQELFALAKRYESVKEALLPTGDELFLGLALDNYARLEKQAYFSVYTQREPEKKQPITLELAEVKRDQDILRLSGDFLDSEIANIQNGIGEEIYIVRHGEVVGFGVIEYSVLVPKYASIGMMVLEKHRQQGYASNILWQLKQLAEAKGRTPLSGCWYYNHNSRKSMESAGAYAQSRLLRFFF